MNIFILKDKNTTSAGYIQVTEEELQAIDMKAEKPEVYVRCPRCGKELHYRAVGNSYEVRCYTDGCIKATSRGI